MNSFGPLQGGDVNASLAELAGEVAARARDRDEVVSTSVAVHYPAQGPVGPTGPRRDSAAGRSAALVAVRDAAARASSWSSRRSPRF